MLVGGLFLREFVADGVPWAHLDIAGPAFNTGGPYGYTPKGGTGVPVRTLARRARRHRRATAEVGRSGVSREVGTRHEPGANACRRRPRWPGRAPPVTATRRREE